MDTKFSVTFDKNNIINSTVSKQMEKYYDYFKLTNDNEIIAIDSEIESLLKFRYLLLEKRSKSEKKDAGRYFEE